MADAQDKVKVCSECGNVDTIDPCTICSDPRRDRSILCVVEEVGDLWALERAGAWTGLYHVLGGTLSAMEGIRPEDLAINHLVERAAAAGMREVVLATNATEGQRPPIILPNG
jgi:recombination protein RecR